MIVYFDGYDGDAVPDNKAVFHVERNKHAKEVIIGTDTLLLAYRIAHKHGEINIKRLIFKNVGSPWFETTLDKDGRLKTWPPDDSIHSKMLAEICGL